MGLLNRNQRLNGINPLAYMGVDAYQPSEFLTNTRAPTTSDNNFQLGAIWLYTNITVTPHTENVYILVALDSGIAKWILFTGGSGTVDNLSGNTGTNPVFPIAGNIKVFGDGTTVNISGDGVNTLTASATGIMANSFPTDSGTATPSSGVLNIKAQNATLGAGSTVLFSAPGPSNTVQLNVTDSLKNTIIGNGAGKLGLTGQQNTALGETSLASITSGLNNTCIGQSSGTALNTGTGNTAVGSHALISATTSTGNVAIGDRALRDLSTSTGRNIAIGTLAGNQLTTAVDNVLIGNLASNAATSGDNNVVIGSSSGGGLVSGSNNIIISGGGNYAGAENANILIGNAGTVAESNATHIGTSQTKTFIAGIAGVTTVVADAVAVLISASTGQLGTISSSIRFKDNVKDLGSISADVLNLRPVVFNYKGHDAKAKHYGLIAEEVATMIPNLVVYDKGGDPASVKYHDLPVLLLNELKKLQKRVDLLEHELKSYVNDIQ